MKKLLIILSILLIASDLTEITAKDTKKKLEDRVLALETSLQQVIDTINGPVSSNIQLMDERTLDLNNRLRKFELSQEDDKATKVKYALTCENLDDINTCDINVR